MLRVSSGTTAVGDPHDAHSLVHNLGQIVKVRDGLRKARHLLLLGLGALLIWDDLQFQAVRGLSSKTDLGGETSAKVVVSV